MKFLKKVDPHNVGSGSNETQSSLSSQSLKEPQAYCEEPKLSSFGGGSSDWKTFFKSRLTEDWEKKSEVAKKAAQANLYPQKRARRGYARYEQDVIKELAKKGIYETSIGRRQLWKLMRTDAKGEVVEGAKTVATRIDYFMRKSEQGQLDESEDEDVLSKALGEKEHGGRVKGVAVGVTKREYFGPLQTKEYKDQVTKRLIFWSIVSISK